MARRLEVVITGDARSLERAFGRASRAANTFGGRVTGGLRRVARAGLITAGAAGLGGLFVTLRAGTKEWTEQAKVAAQTEAVLKSTHGAANVTAEGLAALGKAVRDYSGLSDEAVQSAGNLLLTFPGVRNEIGKGNDIFNQATRSVADMSVALGRDMATSAIQLGKALHDPIRGMTALRRAGVAFTEAQREQIKAMVEAGDTLGAQKLILQELQVEFGGSAKALGETLPGQINIAKERFADLAATLVEKLIPAVNKVLAWINDHWPEIEATFRAVFDGIAWAVQHIFAPATRGLIVAGQAVVDWVRANWPEISRVVTGVMTAVRTIVETVVGIIRPLWRAFGDEILAVTRTSLGGTWNIVRAILGQVKNYIEFWLAVLRGDWSGAWREMKELVTGQLNLIKLVITTAFNNIKTVATAITSAMVSALSAIVGKLAGVFRAAFQAVVDAVRGLAGAAFDAAKSFGQAIVDGIVSALRAIGQFVVDLIVKPINAVIGRINAIKIPSVHVTVTVPGWVPFIGGKSTGFSTPAIDPIPHIPELATGGRIDETGVAVVHRGETVLPAGAGGVIEIHIHAGTVIGGNLRQVAVDLEPHIRAALLRARGRNVSLGMA